MLQSDNQEASWLTRLVDLAENLFEAKIEVGAVVKAGQRVAAGKSIEPFVLRTTLVDQAQDAMRPVGHTIIARIPAPGIFDPDIARRVERISRKGILQAIGHTAAFIFLLGRHNRIISTGFGGRQHQAVEHAAGRHLVNRIKAQQLLRALAPMQLVGFNVPLVGAFTNRIHHEIGDVAPLYAELGLRFPPVFTVNFVRVSGLAHWTSASLPLAPCLGDNG